MEFWRWLALTQNCIKITDLRYEIKQNEISLPFTLPWELTLIVLAVLKCPIALNTTHTDPYQIGNKEMKPVLG